MEKRNIKITNNCEFGEKKYNNSKNKPNEKEINDESKIKSNKEILSNKNDNTYKKPKIINQILKENSENIINDNEKKTEIEIDPIKANIFKMKQENKILLEKVEKRNKLIINLKDQIDDQKIKMAEYMMKIDNIKKFIPEKSIKNKQNEKFEEQLAIAAVNEQIMKVICDGSDGHGVMNKIFNGDKKDNIMKNKIEQITQVYYKTNKFENFECTICFDIFKENELLKQLNCKHIFHKECLSQWLLNENKCPVCEKIC